MSVSRGLVAVGPGSRRPISTPPAGRWPARSLPTLVGDATWLRLVGLSELVAFRHRDRLIVQDRADDEVFVLRSGFVLISHEGAGRSPVVLAVRGPGDLVGELAGWTGRPRSATVVASGAVQAWRLPYRAFHDVVSGSPRATTAMAHVFAGKLGNADRRLLDTRVQPAIVRTARILDDLVERYGERIPGGGLAISVRMTRDDLARLVGMHKSSIERSLRMLRDDGVVQLGPGIRVVDRPALRRIGWEPRPAKPSPDGPDRGRPGGSRRTPGSS